MVNRLALCTIILFLSGCATTVPVVMSFPKAPDDLMTSCPDLEKIPPNTTKISQVISVVSDNYSQYHECRSKVEDWIDWYNQQQKIYSGFEK